MLLGKLFSKKRSKPGNIYFHTSPQVRKTTLVTGTGLLFQKKYLKLTHAHARVVENTSHFQMFLYTQGKDLFNISRRLQTPHPLYNDKTRTNLSYTMGFLKFHQKLLQPLSCSPQNEVIWASPTSAKPLRTYYSNLQPRSTGFITRFHLLKKLTSRYDLVRKVHNYWETFSNRRNQLSRFSKHVNPTISMKSPNNLTATLSQTVTNTLPTYTGPTQVYPTPARSPSSLFTKLFSKNLLTSFWVYKRLYLFTPLLTEKPASVLTKSFNKISFTRKQTFSNIICVSLPRTPKLFLNMQHTKSVKFQTNFLSWYNFLLIRFLQHTTGLKVSLMFNPYLHKFLSLTERAQLDLWTQRVKGFQRIIGPKISLKESLQVTYLSLKLKDPSLLSSWLSRTIHKVSFWKYRAFFRYLKFLLQNLFLPSFASLGMKGVKLKLKGKVSVAGNARTRSIYYRVGRTGQSTFSSKVLHNLTFFYTFTGILGLQIWFYF